MNISLFDDLVSSHSLCEQLEAFHEFGPRTSVERRNGIPYYINEFWTSRQRQCHSIHEISYRACFKPQLPGFFIKRLTKPGDAVYDPFMGRGTTPVEAALQQRTPVGNDINPLCRMLVAPRVRTPSFHKVRERLLSIPWPMEDAVEREDLLVFYHPRTLSSIEFLRRHLLQRSESGELDEIDAWIRMVTINRLTGHSKGFLSVYTLPPNQAVSVRGQARINERRSQLPEFRDIAEIILRKSRSLLADGGVQAKGKLLVGRSWDTPGIKDKSVSLTVTSPPFLDVVNYEADNWLRCWFAGVDPGTVETTMHRSVDDWQKFVRKTLMELGRITVPGGHVAFEVGEVRHGTVRLEENVIAAAAGLPFEAIGVMINQQQFTKTANCWGVTNNTRGTNSNRIVLLRKA